MGSETVALDEVLKLGWREHADAPQAVAEQLAAALHQVQTSEQVPPFARLLVHVFGEHLGQWQRGVDLLEVLRPVFDSQVSAIASLDKGVATLRFGAGDMLALNGLSVPDRASCLAGAASALAARKDISRAIDAYREALCIAEEGLPAESPTIRELAVAGNNLACILESHSERQMTETQAMLVAAHAALKYWKLAGTWLEEERAHYRLTRSLLQAGQAAAAIGSAQACVDVCLGNGAPAFELFFGYAVLAIAHRAAGDTEVFQMNRQLAMQHWNNIADDERPWCKDDLDELAA